MTGKLVSLASFTDPFKARIVAQKLEEAGIRTFLEGDTTGEGLTGMGSAVAHVTLDVEEADAERAQEILAAPPPVETGIQTEPDEQDAPEDLTATPSLADHCLRAALFGLLLLPALIGMVMQLYSLWLGVKIASREEDLDESHNWKVYTGLAIDAVGLILGAFYVRWLVVWLFA
jgi:hypothetical protein